MNSDDQKVEDLEAKDEQIKILKNALIEKEAMLICGFCLQLGSALELMPHQCDEARKILTKEIKGIDW